MQKLILIEIPAKTQNLTMFMDYPKGLQLNFIIQGTRTKSGYVLYPMLIFGCWMDFLTKLCTNKLREIMMLTQ